MSEFPLQIKVPCPERQNRLITFFKWLLAIPWIAWLYIWNIAFQILLVLAWFVLLFTAKWPKEFFSFAESYFRYSVRASAWILNLTSDWPPWHGRPDDDYGLILNLEMKDRYDRLKTGFRLILMIPLTILMYGLMFYALIFWFIGFWAILFIGRLPDWCRRPMADAFVMSQKINAYTYLLVEEWPPLTGEDEIERNPDQSFAQTAQDL